ncbi:hypothetical protein V8B97DRAFT_1394280 [Scleroderma yunnanense]
MNQRDSFPMPYCQIRFVWQLSRETEMDPIHFSKFRSTVKSAAKMYLNCELRPEEQNISALRRFMDAVHEREPSICKKYEESWPVMAYLEIYLLGRIRFSAHQNNRYGPRTRYVRCPEPIWFRYAEARSTGRFRRNCQSGNRRAVERPLPSSDLYKPPSKCTSGIDIVEKILKHEYHSPSPSESFCEIRDEDEMSEIGSDTDNSVTVIESGSNDRRRGCLAVASIDPLLGFLSSVRPNLGNFRTHFIDMGFTDGEALDAFFSWPIDVQESTMRTQFAQTMNVLQLTGLLVTLRARQMAL